MDLTYVLDYRLRRTSDGAVWTDTCYDASFWDCYLRVFNSVSVVSRVEEVTERCEGWRRVDGSRVNVRPIPHYLGPAQYLRRAYAVRRAVKAAMAPEAAVILRVPSQLSTCAASVLQGAGRPYGVEVVGDPSGALARGVVSHPLRPLLRWRYTRCLVNQCRNCATAAYVSTGLKRAYPPGKYAAAAVCSDVRLEADWIVTRPRAYQHGRRCRLITVGTLSQKYKGTDRLIEALWLCRQKGLDIDLTVVGDGRYRPEFEALAAALGVGDRVRFVGMVAWGEDLRAQLDNADLFVLPSLVEALPRALIEAMARALPCVASSVGAVPELLDAEDLVPPGNTPALADALSRAIRNPARLELMSARNLEIAGAFAPSLLGPQWRSLHTELRTRTARSLRDKDVGPDPVFRRA